MLTRSILARGAFVALVLVGLFALADGMVRAQLQQAVEAPQDAVPPAVVRVAGAAD